MSEGPTLVGSIVALLKIDSSDWNAKLAEAGAAADELGTHDPTIKVDANIGEAMSKLEAVRLAEDRVAITSAALAGATRALQNAEADSSTTTAHHTELLRNHTVALNAGSNALRDLLSAQADLDTENEHSTRLMNLSINRWGLILAAVAVLVPMIAPLGGFLVGVGGAFGLMGAAGIAAVSGIKKEMEQGTAVGESYRAGLGQLKNNWDELGHTSAVTMLQSFNAAGESLNKNMPQLNAQIGQFAQILGTTGVSVLNGVITGLEVANPLFMLAGQYVEQLAAGFQKWTSDGGLKSFVNYAIQSFPIVVDAVGSLANMVMHLIDALAPLGTLGLMIITGISDAINLIPTPALTTLITVAAAVFVGFKAWAMLAPIINLFSVALTGTVVVAEAAMGPIGLVIGLVTALAAVLAVSVIASQEATAAVDSYSSALDQDSGAIGANTRAQAAKALVDAGAVDTMKQLGVSAKTVTDAALGNADAQKKVAEATEKTTSAAEGAMAVGARGQKATDEHSKSLVGLATAAQEAQKQILAQAAAIEEAVKNGISYNEAMNLSGSVAQTMAANLGMSVSAYNALTTAQNAATAAAKTFQTEMDILNGVQQSVEQTTLSFAQDVLNLGSTIASTAAQSNAATATSLDINTSAGIKNHQMILQGVQDAQAKAQAIVSSEGNSVAAQAKGVASAQASKAALIEAAVAAGIDRTAVTNLVNSLMTIPPAKATKVTVMSQEAMQDAERIKGALNSIPRSISIQVTAHMPTIQNGVLTHSSGGYINYLASGGVPNFQPKGTDTVPAMLTPGEFVVKASSAGYRPDFMTAYNANPQRALAAVAAGGGGQGGDTHVHITNKSGVGLSDLIEIEIEKAGQRSKVDLSTGLQKGTF